MIMSDENLIKKLRCPECFNTTILKESDSTLLCKKCGHSFYKNKGIWSLLKTTDKSQEDIQKFWGDLYKQLYEKQDKELTPSRLDYLLGELGKYEKANKHPIGNEIDLKNLEGKSVIEIGCGAGSHSCLFKKAGASVVSVDITPERVLATQARMGIIEIGNGIAVQANAERLPFNDNEFDLVYSFGVLHHTTDTQAAVNEVYRILKPEGRAVIMLYSKSSSYYLINYFFWHGIVKGNIHKGKDWLGPVSEGKPEFDQVNNPFTRVYTRGELKNMFRSFKNITIRKGAFSFNQIPKIGFYLDRWLIKMKICNTSDSGYLVWDRPLRFLTNVELMLGKVAGFAFYIVCEKR